MTARFGLVQNVSGAPVSFGRGGVLERALVMGLVLTWFSFGRSFGRDADTEAVGRGNSSGGEDWAVAAELYAAVAGESAERRGVGRAGEGADRRDYRLAAEKTLKNWRAKVASPNAAIDVTEGELALKEGEPLRGRSVLKHDGQRSPKDDAGAWRLAASAYEAEKDWPKAADAMGQALALRTDTEGFVEGPGCGCERTIGGAESTSTGEPDGRDGCGGAGALSAL